jgi:hypothetical protein
VTSTISARRIPTLSIALKVSGSSPERVPDASRPCPAVGAVSAGAVLSVIVTREPKTWMNEPEPSPRLQAELSSVQQPVETVR